MRLKWGTYGKGVAEAYGRGEVALEDLTLTWVWLDECDTEHLEAILKSENLEDLYKMEIEEILQERQKCVK